MKYLILLLCLSGCATNVKLYTASSSIGQVNINYTYNSTFETPVINWKDANNKARLICKGWNYNHIKLFDTISQVCVSRTSKLVCQRITATIHYQCIN